MSPDGEKRQRGWGEKIVKIPKPLFEAQKSEKLWVFLQFLRPKVPVKYQIMQFYTWREVPKVFFVFFLHLKIDDFLDGPTKENTKKIKALPPCRFPAKDPKLIKKNFLWGEDISDNQIMYPPVYYLFGLGSFKGW